MVERAKDALVHKLAYFCREQAKMNIREKQGTYGAGLFGWQVYLPGYVADMESEMAWHYWDWSVVPDNGLRSIQKLAWRCRQAGARHNSGAQ